MKIVMNILIILSYVLQIFTEVKTCDNRNKSTSYIGIGQSRQPFSERHQEKEPLFRRRAIHHSRLVSGRWEKYRGIAWRRHKKQFEQEWKLETYSQWNMRTLRSAVLISKKIMKFVRFVANTFLWLIEAFHGKELNYCKKPRSRNVCHLIKLDGLHWEVSAQKKHFIAKCKWDIHFTYLFSCSLTTRRKKNF